jgi:hypothetical protein
VNEKQGIESVDADGEMGTPEGQVGLDESRMPANGMHAQHGIWQQGHRYKTATVQMVRQQAAHIQRRACKQTESKTSAGDSKLHKQQTKTR